MSSLVVHRHDEDLMVAKVPREADLDGFRGGPIWGLLETAADKTVLAPDRHRDELGPDASVEGPFRAFEVQGPLHFSLTGVLAGLLNPLAQVEISVFVLSTFDTGWVLVSSAAREMASATLRSAGHTVINEERS